MATFRTPLVRSDFKTETWQHLGEHIDQRIDELRGDLESLENTEHTSAAIRGRISELRKILALAKAPVDVPRAGDRVTGRYLADPNDPPFPGGY